MVQECNEPLCSCLPYQHWRLDNGQSCPILLPKSKFQKYMYTKTSKNPVKKITACPLAGESWWPTQNCRCLKLYSSGCHYQPWLLQKRPLPCCRWSKALLVLIYVVVRHVEALTFFLWKVFFVVVLTFNCVSSACEKVLNSGLGPFFTQKSFFWKFWKKVLKSSITGPFLVLFLLLSWNV